MCAARMVCRVASKVFIVRLQKSARPWLTAGELVHAWSRTSGIRAHVGACGARRDDGALLGAVGEPAGDGEAEAAEDGGDENGGGAHAGTAICSAVLAA